MLPAFRRSPENAACKFTAFQTAQTYSGRQKTLRIHNPAPGLKEERLLRTLLPLVSTGYLNLDTVAGIVDYPLVSIIIPVRSQPENLSECLQSIALLDYPSDKLEVIVVDDASDKPVK